MINLAPVPPSDALPRWFYELYRVLTERITDILTVNLTNTGNDSGSGNTTLFSYTLTQNTLFSANQCINVEAFGSLAANGNTKRLRLNFGSTTIFDTGSITTNDGDFKLSTNIFMLTTTSQEIEYVFHNSNAATVTTLDNSTASETLTSNLNIVLIGNGTDASDVLLKGVTIKWIPKQ